MKARVAEIIEQQLRLPCCSRRVRRTKSCGREKDRSPKRKSPGLQLDKASCQCRGTSSVFTPARQPLQRGGESVLVSVIETGWQVPTNPGPARAWRGQLPRFACAHGSRSASSSQRASGQHPKSPALAGNRQRQSRPSDPSTVGPNSAWFIEAADSDRVVALTGGWYGRASRPRRGCEWGAGVAGLAGRCCVSRADGGCRCVRERRRCCDWGHLRGAWRQLLVGCWHRQLHARQQL